MSSRFYSEWRAKLPPLRTKLRTHDGADAINVVRFRHGHGINLNAALTDRA
jgi:hypothetical protein